MSQILIKYVYIQKIHLEQSINTWLKKVGLNHYDDPKVFIEYSNDIQNVYKNIEECNLGKKT